MSTVIASRNFLPENILSLLALVKTFSFSKFPYENFDDFVDSFSLFCKFLKSLELIVQNSILFFLYSMCSFGQDCNGGSEWNRTIDLTLIRGAL